LRPDVFPEIFGVSATNDENGGRAEDYCHGISIRKAIVKPEHSTQNLKREYFEFGGFVAFSTDSTAQFEQTPGNDVSGPDTHCVNRVIEIGS
jgi:hypothetical protein